MQRPTANVRHRRQKTDPNIGGKPTPAHRSAPSTTPAGTDVNHERVVNGRDIDPFAVVLNLKARLSRVEGTSNVASKRSRCAPSDSAHSRKKVSSEREQFRCDRLGDSVPKVAHARVVAPVVSVGALYSTTLTAILAGFR